jgi:hypothetical protein
MRIAPSAQKLIETLSLVPHPEGGYFRETYRSRESVAAEALPERFAGPRPHATAILFLLTPDTFSALHRVAADETYHHYLGGAVELALLYGDRRGETVRLGKDLLAGERVQHVVPHGAWQGSRVAAGAEYALLGCTVAPGFDFADFEMGDREALQRAYPAHRDLIEALTR